MEHSAASGSPGPSHRNPSDSLVKAPTATNHKSTSPWGHAYPLPSERDDRLEFDRLQRMVHAQRETGREIVVVLGVGFVGAVMAAVIADSTDQRGQPAKFVIAVQRPSVRGYWKVPVMNSGRSPVKADDPQVEALIRRCVLEKGTLTATHHEGALQFADVVVVDVQCNYQKNSLGNVRDGRTDMEALEASCITIAWNIRPNALVLIETTVPPGTTEQVLYPIMKKIFRQRGITEDPLLAHSYERVMPGRNYVASVRDMWRVCSGISKEARARVAAFLSEVLNTQEFPLTVLDRPIESETAKIMENSYRATILAFMDEWSLFAERNGVDLKRVIEAIKIRPTHSNMMFPGPGIGGYCLPKDGVLGMWAYRHILGWEDDIFKITPMAIDINDTRSLHVPQLVRDALRNMGEPIAAADVLVLGISYRKDVGDTRFSGSELIVRRLTDMGATVRVHDPFVDSWPEIEDQEDDPESSKGYGRFFSRQTNLKSLVIEKDLWSAMEGVKAVVIAVPHSAYLSLKPERVFQAVGARFAIVDCFCILDDSEICRYLELGCEVKGLGRGHIKRLKESLRKRRE